MCQQQSKAQCNSQRGKKIWRCAQDDCMCICIFIVFSGFVFLKENGKKTTCDVIKARYDVMKAKDIIKARNWREHACTVQCNYGRRWSQLRPSSKKGTYMPRFAMGPIPGD